MKSLSPVLAALLLSLPFAGCVADNEDNAAPLNTESSEALAGARTVRLDSDNADRTLVVHRGDTLVLEVLKTQGSRLSFSLPSSLGRSSSSRGANWNYGPAACESGTTERRSLRLPSSVALGAYTLRARESNSSCTSTSYAWNILVE